MLKLVIEEDSCFRECMVCGDEIPDPYLEDDDEEEAVMCSTCQAVRYHRAHLRRLAVSHAKNLDLGEPVCQCGKSLRNCTPWNCDPLPIRPHPRRRPKPPTPQGDLFKR